MSSSQSSSQIPVLTLWQKCVFMCRVLVWFFSYSLLNNSMYVPWIKQEISIVRLTSSLGLNNQTSNDSPLLYIVDKTAVVTASLRTKTVCTFLNTPPPTSSSAMFGLVNSSYSGICMQVKWNHSNAICDQLFSFVLWFGWVGFHILIAMDTMRVLKPIRLRMVRTLQICAGLLISTVSIWPIVWFDQCASEWSNINRNQWQSTSDAQLTASWWCLVIGCMVYGGSWIFNWPKCPQDCPTQCPCTRKNHITDNDNDNDNSQPDHVPQVQMLPQQKR